MNRFLRSIPALLLTGMGSALGAALPHFTQPNAVWNQDVTNAPTRSRSDYMMAHLETLAKTIQNNGQPCYDPSVGKGCWGDTKDVNFQIDLSMYVMHANGATPTAGIVAWPDSSSYYVDDCDVASAQTQFPVPVGGGIEGSGDDTNVPPILPSYTCDGGDCHLLVGNDATHVLWESYATDSLDASGLHTICALHWYLDRVYPRYGRGEHCTSADGAGFPVAPLLFNADEVYAAVHGTGDLGHAIRFILGNNRISAGMYVHPASHGLKSNVTTDPGPDAVPYGAHLRLKGSFNIAAFSSNLGVQVILRTLQKYGMFLSDGGGIPLTGESDHYNMRKWDTDLNMDTHSLFGIRPTDFDVIETGDPMQVTYNCVRTPDDFIFIDGNDY